jgi:hypothetical protein
LVFHGTEYDDYDVDGTTLLNSGSAFIYTQMAGAPTDLEDLFAPTHNDLSTHFASFIFSFYRFDPGTGFGALTSVQSAGDMIYSVDAPLPSSSAPEPASWAFMIVGFSLVGGALRRHARAPSLSPA